MPLKVLTRADDSEKHEWDINCLLFHNGKLYSGADDGKIKVKTNVLHLKKRSKTNTSFHIVVDERFETFKTSPSPSLFSLQYNH